MLYTHGSRGNVVRQIQAKVGAQVTGVWDTATARKVLEFQKQNGLHQTAEVNNETYNALFPPKVVKPKLKAEEVAQPKKKTYSEENTKKQKEDGTTKL